MILLFFIALTISYTSIYVNIILNRNLTGQQYLIDRSNVRRYLSYLNILSFVGILLWGFSLGWFVPIISIIISGLTVGVLYDKLQLGLLYIKIQVFFDIIPLILLMMLVLKF